MSLVTSCFQSGKSYVIAAKEHVKKHCKTYFVGISILLAAATAYFIVASLMPLEIHRYNNGRTLNVLGDMQMSPVREVDPTPPYLRRMASYIKGKHNATGSN